MRTGVYVSKFIIFILMLTTASIGYITWPLIILYVLIKKLTEKIDEVDERAYKNDHYSTRSVESDEANDSFESYSENTDRNVYTLRKPRTNCDLTEIEVYTRLSRHLSSEYTILNNIIVPYPSTLLETSQIDHVVISRYGIFCIETKSHAGSIYGSINSTYWKQYLQNSQYPIYNPTMQNNGHVKSLNRVIGSSKKNAIIPIVVFPNAYRIKVTPDNSALDMHEAIYKIKSYTTPVYSEQEVLTIKNKIISADLSYLPNSSYNHAKQVKKFINAQ